MNRRAFLVLAVAAALPPLAGRAAQAREPKTRSGEDSYLPIEPLTAYTRKPNGRRGVMTVQCGLDIPDPRLRQRADESLPRLRAAYVQTLQVYAGGLPAGYPPDPEFLGRSLQRLTDRILGERGARLLLGAILVN